jgi:hypothetical protein
VAPFVHLHVHSQYSMLDGAIRVKELVSRVKALGMKAVALTDHSNMHGAIDFYKKCKDADVQPSSGARWESATRSRATSLTRMAGMRTYHLPMLARSAEGYRSLIALNSRSWTATPLGCSPAGGPRATSPRCARTSSCSRAASAASCPRRCCSTARTWPAAVLARLQGDRRARQPLRRAAGPRARRAAHREPPARRASRGSWTSRWWRRTTRTTSSATTRRRSGR